MLDDNISYPLATDISQIIVQHTNDRGYDVNCLKFMLDDNISYPLATDISQIIVQHTNDRGYDVLSW